MTFSKQDVDGRDKPGHDKNERSRSGMTELCCDTDKAKAPALPPEPVDPL